MYKNLKIRIVSIIIFAVVAGLLFNKVVENYSEKIPIVVASHKIEAKTIIQNSDVELLEVNKEDCETIYPNAIYDIQEVIGAVTKVDIDEKKPIEKKSSIIAYDDEKEYAMKSNGDVDTSFFIPKDKRLISIEVDKTGSVNNTITRGDYIDIIFSSVNENTGGLYSILLLQHIQVFGVSDDVEGNGFANGTKEIILLATPDDCVTLAAAGRNGVLDCTLNPLSGETTDIPAVNVHSFVVNKPLSKAENISYVQNYISNMEISESGEQSIIGTLDQELSKDKLIESINASILEDSTRKQLLEVLGGDNNEEESITSDK